MDISPRKSFKSNKTSRQSQKFIRDLRKKIAWTWIFAAISLISWLWAGSVFTRLPALSVQSVNISGGVSEDIALSVRAVVNRNLNGNYLGLFSKSNIFTYPRRTIVRAVKDAVPGVDRIDVSRDGLNALSVIIREKSPAAVVCANLPDWRGSDLIFDASDSCYLVDDQGSVFMSTTSSDGFHNRYYVVQPQNASSSAHVFFDSADKFKALQSFYDGALSAGIAAKAILIKGEGEYELYAPNSAADDPIQSSDITVVYFNEHNVFVNELGNLISFWNGMKDRFKGEVSGFYSVDLRYGSNVFYRATKSK